MYRYELPHPHKGYSTYNPVFHIAVNAYTHIDVHLNMADGGGYDPKRRSAPVQNSATVPVQSSAPAQPYSAPAPSAPAAAPMATAPASKWEPCAWLCFSLCLLLSVVLAFFRRSLACTHTHSFCFLRMY